MNKQEKIRRHVEANKMLQAVHPGFFICYRKNSAHKVVALGAHDQNWVYVHSVRVETGTAMDAIESLPQLIELMNAVCDVPAKTSA